MTSSDDEFRPRPAEPDDLPPSGEEARAQRGQTVKPWVWLVVGLFFVVIFLGVLLALPGKAPPPAPALPAPQKVQPAGARR